MKRVRFVAFILLLFVLSSFPTTALATEIKPTEDVLNGIQKAYGAKNKQSFLDGYLTDEIGLTAEWYIPALLLDGTSGLDYTKYEAELRNTLVENPPASPVTRMKLALTLALLGSNSELIQTTLRDNIGQLGLMSYVYGLHLLTAGYEAEGYSPAYVCSELVSRQLTDGSWAVSGNTGNVDATAMVLQSLAPYKDESSVSASIDAGLAYLVGIQNPNGTFTSYGQENPESGAMVLLALSCLGTNADDVGFSGGTNALLQGIFSFLLPSGLFSHTLGGDANNLATSQVYLALSVHENAGNGSFSVFVPHCEKNSFIPSLKNDKDYPILPIVLIFVSVGCITVGSILFFKKKCRKK